MNIIVLLPVYYRKKTLIEDRLDSGGHMWVDNSNNIKEGVTIDLTLLTKRTYNPETKLVSLEPGSRWKDVYRDLVSRKWCLNKLRAHKHDLTV